MPASPWTDLTRPPLRESALQRALVVPGGVWTAVRVRAETGSTNADAADAARTGAPEGLVVVAESQTAGRGRLGRTWTAPPRSALTFSVLLRPGGVEGSAPGGEGVPVRRWAWLPLLAGVAVLEALDRIGSGTEAPVGPETGLKWPNDLVFVGPSDRSDDSAYAGRKLGGILAERTDDAVVVGVGLNVSLDREELPVPTATSLRLEGLPADRDPLLRAVLRALGDWYRRWRTADGDADACGLADAYRARCSTLGRRVRVELPGNDLIEGEAVGIDVNGCLVVRTAVRERTVSAGDVVHLR